MHYEDSLDPARSGFGPAPDAPLPETAVPEKFRDPVTGAVRTDALLRAYLDLEKRMHAMVKVPGDEADEAETAAFRRAMGIPDRPDDYKIEERHPMLSPCHELNCRLHEAGFTPRQAQLVYDLAHERVVPMFEDMKAEYETKESMEKLRAHFGGDARWNTAARQILAWGKANLPAQVFEALASSAEGVLAMRTMMASGEPELGRASLPTDDAPDEGALKKMLQDPRYWKKRDPAFIEKVSSGFRRLHCEG